MHFIINELTCWVFAVSLRLEVDSRMTCPSARKDSSSKHHSFGVYTSSVPAPLFFDVFKAVLSLRNCDFSVCSFYVMSSLFTSQCKTFDKSVLILSKLELLKFFILYSLLFTFQMQGCCFRSSMKCRVAFLVHSKDLFTERASAIFQCQERASSHDNA